ncbi:MAG: Gfo/Idh/MocA family oxidoreductase, partial [Blastocatellia bacterium]
MSQSEHKTEDRRDFIRSAGAASLLTAASYGRILGANDRVRVGFIGIGLIGKRHLLDFMAQPDVEIAGIAETYEPRLREGIETAGGKPKGYKDFRRMYDEKNIDAICVSTPDHWHALQSILAFAAGKDVYVEKPLTHALAEGRWMIDAMRKYKRVAQIGTQQRSGEQYHKTVELLRNGHIGEVRGARLASWRNISPGFTEPVGTEPLSETDWNMWLGPAPYVPFTKERCIYHFRWFDDYSG